MEDYLDHALSDLIGVVPYRRRQELRREMADHLDSLAQAYEELGSPPAEAMSRALRQFGPPREIGSRWSVEWGPRRPVRLFWNAAMVTSAALAPITLLTWCLGFFQPHLLLNGPGGYGALILVLVAALASGFRNASFRAAGACLALAGVTASTGILSLFIRHEAGYQAFVLLTALQLLTWLPGGMLAAEVGGWGWERARRAGIRS